MSHRLALAAWACFTVARAAAQEAPSPGGDDDFGPTIEIERIQVTGNSRTREELILRALEVKPGDKLTAGDPRLAAARFRVLALGYFRDVRVRLDKGSRRGAVTLTVSVEERGTATINRLFLGNSALTPIWLGLDVGDSNFLGSGVGVGVAGVWAARSDLPGARAQGALQLSIGDPSVLGTPFGLRGAFLYAVASEPGPDDARDYRRAGGTIGVTWDVTRLTTLSLDLRQEWVNAADPPPLQPRLLAGDSRVGTVALGLDLDTRPDPILPYRGDRLLVSVEAGGGFLGDYQYLRAMARAGHWLPVARRHVLSADLAGGIISGHAPLFDRFYIGDLNPLLTPRPLGLVVSTRKSPDIFGSGIADVSYGRVFGSLTFEYAYQLFRSTHTVYGGDLFAQVGTIALGETDDVRFDLTFNAGLRLDTLIGVFELSLGNALGRIPF